MSSRPATHAGSWYTSSPTKLSTELSSNLSLVPSSIGVKNSYEIPIKGCKAIIAPHAGYSYSGPAAAWAYAFIDPTQFSRVFLLGPSHHVYLQGCAVSSCERYETPLGDIELDRETIDELEKTGEFEVMSKSTDEDEHSIEMHLPYIRKIFGSKPIKLIPILIGSLSPTLESHYGTLLSSYLSSPHTLFIISTDFCHWGTRFRYTPYYSPSLPSSSLTSLDKDWPIHKSIKSLDQRGMDCVAFDLGGGKGPTEARKQFSSYLKETKNTICGRHPIGVLLGALASLEKKEVGGKEGGGGGWEGMRLEWVRYEQSENVERKEGSSVSYASGVVIV